MPTTMDTIGFFHLLEPSLRQTVEERLRLVHLRKGQLATEHGSRSSDVHFLLDGELRVLLFSADGREVSVRTLRAGQMFGELAAIDGLPRSATVAAVRPSVMQSMARADFQTCMASSARASMWLAQQLAAQIRVLTEKIFELSTLNVRSRVHCEVLRLAFVAGVSGNRATIRPSPTHSEIANRIGTHREAVTRELRDLAKREIVTQRRRELEILNVSHLSRIVQRSGVQTAGVYAAPARSASIADFVDGLSPSA